MARLPAFHTRFLRSESLLFQQLLVLVRQPGYLEGSSVRPMTESPYLSPSDVPPATTLATDDKANPALLTIARHLRGVPNLNTAEQRDERAPEQASWLASPGNVHSPPLSRLECSSAKTANNLPDTCGLG